MSVIGDCCQILADIHLTDKKMPGHAVSRINRPTTVDHTIECLVSVTIVLPEKKLRNIHGRYQGFRGAELSGCCGFVARQIEQVQFERDDLTAFWCLNN